VKKRRLGVAELREDKGMEPGMGGMESDAPMI
jgi:hypothetical protein